MTQKQNVLVTGAAGVIGQGFIRHFGETYNLTGLDLKDAPGVKTLVANIDDLDAIAPAFAGIDAVVHLAATISVDSQWDAVLDANLIGTYNVFEAARRAGAKSVVFASSNHAVGGYELDGLPSIYDLDDPRVYDQTVEVRPDSLYGVSKVYGEALGRHYSDAFGLRVYCLRIGSVRADDNPRDPSVAKGSFWLDLTPEQKFARTRATWLSQRDAAGLISACIEAEQTKFAIVYGISNNPRQMWDLSHARDVLGWVPQDAAPEELP
jgi:NAD+ dependent glucose-6-phosphate dehydrogenase